MDIKKIVAPIIWCLVLVCSAPTQAKVVQFSDGYPIDVASPTFSTIFSDGRFSSNLSGRQDGFYGIGFYPNSGYAGPAGTLAINGVGISGEYILFNAPVTLNSLVLSNLLDAQSANTITVTLFNISGNFLTAKTINPSERFDMLVFNTVEVSKVVFSHTSDIHDFSTPQNDFAIYKIGNVIYNQPIVTTVPEPETYIMTMAGLGLIGFMVGRKSRNTRP